MTRDEMITRLILAGWEPRRSIAAGGSYLPRVCKDWLHVTLGGRLADSMFYMPPEEWRAVSDLYLETCVKAIFGIGTSRESP